MRPIHFLAQSMKIYQQTPPPFTQCCPEMCNYSQLSSETFLGNIEWRGEGLFDIFFRFLLNFREVSIYFVQDCLRKNLSRENGKVDILAFIFILMYQKRCLHNSNGLFNQILYFSLYLVEKCLLNRHHYHENNHMVKS